MDAITSESNTSRNLVGACYSVVFEAGETWSYLVALANQLQIYVNTSCCNATSSTIRAKYTLPDPATDQSDRCLDHLGSLT